MYIVRGDSKLEIRTLRFDPILPHRTFTHLRIVHFDSPLNYILLFSLFMLLSRYFLFDANNLQCNIPLIREGFSFIHSLFSVLFYHWKLKFSLKFKAKEKISRFRFRHFALFPSKFFLTTR